MVLWSLNTTCHSLEFVAVTSQDEITGEESDVYAALVPTFTAVFMSLVKVLLHKAQFPPDDEYASWDDGEPICLAVVYTSWLHDCTYSVCTFVN